MFCYRIRTAASPNRTSTIKKIFEAIESTMASIFEPFYDPCEDPVIWAIYKAYIPEIVLVYLSVLQAGSLFLHRDLIVKAMDLSVTLADEEKDWLQMAFKETKRMRELMDRLADVSKTSLDLGEHGDSKSKSKFTKKRGSKGETLRIWDLNAQI